MLIRFFSLLYFSFTFNNQVSEWGQMLVASAHGTEKMKCSDVVFMQVFGISWNSSDRGYL